MRMKRAGNLVMGLACAGMVCLATTIMAANLEDTVRPVLDRLVKAVEANDHQSFVADGTDAIKTGITKQVFEAVSKQMIPRMKKGYTVVYLGDLKQQGCSVYLWKLVFKDGESDTLVKLALTGDKVAGVWFQ